jgi:hypothetical protein
MQGYYFSHPHSAIECEQFLRQGKRLLLENDAGRFVPN